MRLFMASKQLLEVIESQVPQILECRECGTWADVCALVRRNTWNALCVDICLWLWNKKKTWKITGFFKYLYPKLTPTALQSPKLRFRGKRGDFCPRHCLFLSLCGLRATVSLVQASIAWGELQYLSFEDILWSSGNANTKAANNSCSF